MLSCREKRPPTVHNVPISMSKNWVLRIACIIRDLLVVHAWFTLFGKLQPLNATRPTLYRRAPWSSDQRPAIFVSPPVHCDSFRNIRNCLGTRLACRVFFSILLVRRSRRVMPVPFSYYRQAHPQSTIYGKLCISLSRHHLQQTADRVKDLTTAASL